MKHEGILILHSYKMPTEWIGNQLDYTRNVLKVQTDLELYDYGGPNINKIEEKHCSESNRMITHCKNQEKLRYVTILVIFLFCAMPITFKLLQVMFNVCKLFIKNLK